MSRLLIFMRASSYLTKTSHNICTLFIDKRGVAWYYVDNERERRRYDIMYRKFYNTDVDDMIYGSTVTVPSDR